MKAKTITLEIGSATVRIDRTKKGIRATGWWLYPRKRQADLYKGRLAHDNAWVVAEVIFEGIHGVRGTAGDVAELRSVLEMFHE